MMSSVSSTVLQCALLKKDNRDCYDLMWKVWGKELSHSDFSNIL